MLIKKGGTVMKVITRTLKIPRNSKNHAILQKADKIKDIDRADTMPVTILIPIMAEVYDKLYAKE